MALNEYNPIAVFVYFAAVAAVAMFCLNPIICALSLLGAVMYFFVGHVGTGVRSHLFFAAMFVVMTLINPLFYHNGVTVLFVVNDNPVTLEALIYGAAASAMITSVLYWFRSFSHVMTSDKLLYLFGSVSPKAALMLSMTLRYIPLFGLQAKKVNDAGRALGLYKDDNVIDSIRGGYRVFSVMVTWALENGIVTADSMSARGYGTGRRTYFSLYRFRRADVALLCTTVILLALTVTGVGTGALDYGYYPALEQIAFTPLSVASYAAYGALAFMPCVIEVSESVKWKYLKSKI